MARAALSQLDDWQLSDERQDIRGWSVIDHYGNNIGSVHDLIVDTDEEVVETVVLDNGTEYPAANMSIDEDERAVRLLEKRTMSVGSAETARLACRRIRKH